MREVVENHRGGGYLNSNEGTNVKGKLNVEMWTLWGEKNTKQGTIEKQIFHFEKGRRYMGDQISISVAQKYRCVDTFQ